MRGYVRIFKKHGYTALRAARDEEKWLNIEIAKVLKIPLHSVNKVFSSNSTQASWKHIINIGELLGVEKEDYIRREYLLNLPIEVELFFRSLEHVPHPKPKMKRKKAPGRPAQTKAVKPDSETLESVPVFGQPIPAANITTVSPFFMDVQPAYITMLDNLQDVESVTVKTKNGTITWEA